jgi:hypothetical protein
VSASWLAALWSPSLKVSVTAKANSATTWR